MRLLQDVLLARGGAERVFWALEESGCFDSTVVGLNGHGNPPGEGWRVLGDLAAGEEANPGSALVRLVAAAWSEPPLPGVTLATHHHAGLQFAFPPGAATFYLHTPTRFLWEPERASWEHGVFDEPQLCELRRRELRSLEAARAVVTNSHYTSTRISRAYGCSAAVVNPPSELWKSRSRPPGSADELSRPYVITVSRLVFTKGLQRLIETTRSLGLALVVVGSGRARASLGQQAGEDVRFVDGCDDAELRWLLRHSAAFVSFSNEDFGVAAAEALCEGVACVVPEESGVAECICEGSGATFSAGDPLDFKAALEEAMACGRAADALVADYRQHFSVARFVAAMLRSTGR